MPFNVIAMVAISTGRQHLHYAVIR
jgi:hypothetical protein